MGEKKNWPHFKENELSCRCCGKCHMDDGFMQLIEVLRIIYGKPLVVTSAYRCPEHNKAVSSTGLEGPHTTGKAIDIKISRADATQFLKFAINLGITGIGVNQKGKDSGRFLHLDTLEENRPTIWSY